MAHKAKDSFIGIMVCSSRQGRRVLRSYKKYVPKELRAFSFMPSSINWSKRTVLGLYDTGNGYQLKRFPFPDVVYNRYYGAPSHLVKRIEKVIGENKCFNHVTHFDKQKVYDLLSQTDLVQHLPTTLRYHEDHLNRMLESYGTLYLKPRLGYKGRGVYRVELTRSGDVNISHHHVLPMTICRDRAMLKDEVRKLVRSERYLIQQGITTMQRSDKSFDLRVLVQKSSRGLWQITNVICRTAYSGYFNTSMCENVRPGGEILGKLFRSKKASDIEKSIGAVSLKTAETLEELGGYHLGELSVDLVLDENSHAWIIEINGDPQRTLYKDLPGYRKVYRNPMKYAQFLFTQ